MADYPVRLLTPGLGYGAQDLSSEAAEALSEMVYYEEQNAREVAERLRDEGAEEEDGEESSAKDEGDEPPADCGEDENADVVTNLADMAESGCADEVDTPCLSIVLLQVE